MILFPALKESSKEFIRLGLLAVISWLLTQGLVEPLVTYFAGNLEPELKIQIIGLITALLRWLDKYLHEIGKDNNSLSFLKGLTRF